MPRISAIDDVRLPQICLRRSTANPAKSVFPRCGVVSGFAVKRFFARTGFPVNRACVIRQLAALPVDVHGILERLADRAAVADARKRDTAKALFVDRFRRGGEHWRRIDESGRKLLCRELRTCSRDEGEQQTQSLGHFLSRRTFTGEYSPSLLLSWNPHDNGSPRRCPKYRLTDRKAAPSSSPRTASSRRSTRPHRRRGRQCWRREVTLSTRRSPQTP